VVHFTQVDPEAFSAVTVFRGRHRVVVYNDAHAPSRQKSDITHELGHGLLLHEPSPAFGERGFRIWYEDHEDEANYLCGCLLVPREAALHVARKGVAIEAAAGVYGVSPQMMGWRVNGTGASIQARRERAARQRRAASR
jgi:Zn-dependent peptidase ImmA (M78 family)